MKNLHLNEAKFSGIEASKMFLTLLLLPAIDAGEVDLEVEVGAVQVEVYLEVSALPAQEKPST